MKLIQKKSLQYNIRTCCQTREDIPLRSAFRFSKYFRKLKLDLLQWLIKLEDDLQSLRELKESIPNEQK